MFFKWPSGRQKCNSLHFHSLVFYASVVNLDYLPPLHLLCQAVNELLESLAAPLEIVEGFVQSIKVTIPWAALVTDHCTLEVTGLQITCRPKDRTSKLTTPSHPG